MGLPQDKNDTRSQQYLLTHGTALAVVNFKDSMKIYFATFNVDT